MRYMKAPFLFVGALVLLLAPQAQAQQPMKLEIRDGRVSLDAQNVPVRQILAEWARIGGTKIVNGDKVVGAPVTLHFDGVPERQALDIILRTVSGYMLAAREAGSVGVSAFDRILILPTSAGARNTPPPAAAGGNPFAQPGIGQPGMNQPGMMGQPGFVGGQPGFQPGMMGRPMPGVQPVIPPVQVDDIDEPEVAEQPEPIDDDDEIPANMFPRQGNRPGMGRRPNVFPTPQQPVVPGMITPIPPQGEGGQPAQPATVTPGNPFGIPAGSGGTPGTITPVPQQPRPPR
jgi:hypothetical protein